MSEKLTLEFRTREYGISFLRNALNYLTNIKKRELCLREFNITIEANFKVHDYTEDDMFVPKVLKFKWQGD